jgi:hypothetical protein
MYALRILKNAKSCFLLIIMLLTFFWNFLFSHFRGNTYLLTIMIYCSEEYVLKHSFPLEKNLHMFYLH